MYILAFVSNARNKADPHLNTALVRVSLTSWLLIINWLRWLDSMNLLQHISEDKYGPVLVTLNPPYEPQPGTIAGRWRYDHPVVSAEVR
jgi:hypothetical protein